FLPPFAEDIAVLRRATRLRLAPGVTDRWIREGKAPDWMRQNQDSIRRIEARQWNKHDFVANLRQAIQPIPVIQMSVPPASVLPRPR
ncbi:MAG: hypothetical protein KC416_09355, partial [Myxococcales bacterium]|nr:hypothetical protein [Myxococcales bacterium]